MFQDSRRLHHEAVEPSGGSATPSHPFEGRAELTLGHREERDVRKQILNLTAQLRIDKFYDVKDLVETARAGGVSIPSLQGVENLRKVDMPHVVMMLNDISEAVLLPKGELHIINFDSSAHVFRGRIDTRSWERIPYLGGRDIWYADIRFDEKAVNKFGLALGNLAFVDKTKAFQDNYTMRAQIGKMTGVSFSIVNPYIPALRAQLDAEGIGVMQYPQIFGVDRLKYEEVNHCRDNIFAELMGVRRADNQRFDQIKCLMAPHSTLLEVLERRGPQGTSDTTLSALAEFSAQMAGALEEVRAHLKAGKPTYAYCAFLDFMMMNQIKSIPAMSAFGPEHQPYMKASELLAISLKALGLETPLQVLEVVNEGPHHPGVVAEVLLERARTQYFLSHEERVAILEAKRTAEQ